MHKAAIQLNCGQIRSVMHLQMCCDSISWDIITLRRFQFAGCWPQSQHTTFTILEWELERDFTTTAMAKAILRLKTLAFIPS